MATIDVQVHCYERNHPGRPWHAVLAGPPEVTADDMIKAMASVGVDGGLLVSVHTMYRWDASYAVAVQKAHPDKFAVIKPVDPNDPKVEGTIAADSVDVWGRVSGTIMGSRVVLHPSAEVEGDIHAKTLSVSDGASFEGRSRKVTDAASIAPRLDPGAAPAHTGAPVPVPRSLPPQTAAVN